MTDQPGTGDRPMSYSEKYRGTEWGRPEPPPPPPPSSRGPWLIAVVAVVAIALAGVGLAVLALSPAGPSASAPSAPAAGVGSLGSPKLAPTPSPTVDPGAAVLTKFWTLVSAPDLSYHMTAKGKTTLDRRTVQTYSESLDIVGDTYSGTITSKFNGKAQIARKDGVIWVKLPGHARAGRQTSTRYARLTPFLYLQMAAWVDYVKPVTIDGRPLHLLRSNRYYRPDIARMIDLLKFPWDPDLMVLDIYVTDDGVPVSATFKLDVSVTDISGEHPIHARTDFVFSKVGEELKITVPKR